MKKVQLVRDIHAFVPTVIGTCNCLAGVDAIEIQFSSDIGASIPSVIGTIAWVGECGIHCN